MSQPTDDSNLPLVQRIPPATVASPSELRPQDPGNIRWYRPTFWEGAQLLGWRWIYYAPAGALLLGMAMAPWFLWMFQVLAIWWKLMIILVGLPTVHAINLSRNILRTRKEPFCIHCGYDLRSLPDNHRCPECGEPFNFRVIEEYKRDPDWFIQRYHMQGDIPPSDTPFEARRSTRPRSRDGT